jgi:hypothetical protein
MANKQYAMDVCRFIKERFKEELTGFPQHFTTERIISREDF